MRGGNARKGQPAPKLTRRLNCTLVQAVALVASDGEARSQAKNRAS